jgi:plastocyanin
MFYNQSLSLSYRLFFTVLFVSSPLLTHAATHEVLVRNNFFSPNNLTIEVGDTVHWSSNGGFHDVTADDNSFASPTSSSINFSRTFNSVAEILYYCSVHSSPGLNINNNMNGRINVVEASVTTDVSVESVDATDGSYKAGEDVRIKATLNNTSAADSGTFNVKFYASADSNITTGDILLGSKEISNIAAGSIENLDESINLPEGLAHGDYFIGAMIDLDDTNTGNNVNVDGTTIYVFTRFIMNAGLNDAWFNPVTDGQGFFVTVFADLGFVTLAWFTYDTELPPLDATANLGDPGHRWLTAGGVFADNQVVMNIEFTSGGIFDTSTPIQRTDPPGSDGTLILTFNDCLSGTIEYDITSINAKSTVPIQRVALDNVALCETLLRESQEVQ